MESRLNLFIESDEEQLALEPMNSFRRRMVHNLATAYALQTESRGDGPERHVFLIKTPDSAVPAERPQPPARERDEAPRPARGRERERDPERDEPRERGPGRALDYGSQTFPVNPGRSGVRMALKRDGSIELYQERDKSQVVSERLVTAREIRVRDGKILQPGDPEW
jgi:hypothetical protein